VGSSRRSNLFYGLSLKSLNFAGEQAIQLGCLHRFFSRKSQITIVLYVTDMWKLKENRKLDSNCLGTINICINWCLQ
jgi:hypothetical protein